MGYSYGINTTNYKTYAELKADYPDQPDGVYALFPTGPNGPAVVSHCITHEGEHYQAIMSQFGGPKYDRFGTNISNQLLFDNYQNYDGIIQPYSEDGQMYSRINKAGYDFWSTQRGVKWYKRTRSYTEAGVEQGIGSLSHDIILEYDYNVNWLDVWEKTTNTELPGYVSMTLNGQDYGSTKYTKSSSTSKGFANEQNGDNNHVPSGEPSMLNWNARHVISYVHASNGYNATRCQLVCWNGGEDAAMEQLWYVKYINE